MTEESQVFVLRPSGASYVQGDFKYGQTVFRCHHTTCPNPRCSPSLDGCQRCSPAWLWYEAVWPAAMAGDIPERGAVVDVDMRSEVVRFVEPGPHLNWDE